jgi:hypothetical protein
MKLFVPGLSELALRLFHTPANSVPSVRSFSTRNLVQNVKRNSLHSAVLDKVSYICKSARMYWIEKTPRRERGSTWTRMHWLSWRMNFCVHWRDPITDVVIYSSPMLVREMEAARQANERAAQQRETE